MAAVKSAQSTKLVTTPKKIIKTIGIRMISKSTENVISFMYLSDQFSKAIFKCKADQVLATQTVLQKNGTTKTAKEIIEELMSNSKVTCIVTDLTIDKFEGITLDEY